MRKVLFLLAVLIFTVAACASTATVAGNWTVDMAGRRGPETLDLAIEEGDNGLTVTGTHSRLGNVEGSGTLNGDAIVIEVTATGQRKLGYKLEGTVTDDKMAGTRRIDRSKLGGNRAGSGGAANTGARGTGENRSGVSNEWTAERK